MKPIGTETVREELEYIPAKLRIIRYVSRSYECPQCKYTAHPYIIKSLAPTSLMSHSLASPSSIANVMYQKYVNGKLDIILYGYRPSRSGENAVNYLNGFSGYVHADGYSGYNRLPGITRCGCWAHLRRKFVEAIPQKKAKGTKQTTAEIGRDYANSLFKIEDSLKEFNPSERYSKRLELEKLVVL